MRQFVTNNAVVGAAEAGQGQGVGGGTIKYEIDLAIGFKEVAQRIAGRAA